MGLKGFHGFVFFAQGYEDVSTSKRACYALPVIFIITVEHFF